MKLAALVLLLLAGPAWAKDKGGKAEEAPTVEMTGLASFDEVFTRVAEIDAKLTTARRMLTGATHDLNTALALEKGTPLQDALADLKTKADGKIAVAMTGTVPKIEVTDAVPENVQTAIDAVNRMVDGITGSIEELGAIPAEAAELVTACSEFPKTFKAEATSAGIKATEIPKKLAIVKKDVEIAVALPDKATAVVERMTNLLTTVAALAPTKQ